MNNARDAIFWEKELADVVTLELPTDYPRPDKLSQDGKRMVFSIPSHTVSMLKETCHDQHITLFTGLLTLFQVHLRACTGQDVFTVGTGEAARHHKSLDNLVGNFVNPVACKADFRECNTFSDAFARTKRTLESVMEHSGMPISEVMKLAPPQKHGYDPLYQAIIILQQKSETEKLYLEEGLSMERVRINGDTSAISDLLLSIQEIFDGSMRVSVTYRSTLFRKKTITSLVNGFIDRFSSRETDVLPAFYPLPVGCNVGQSFNIVWSHTFQNMDPEKIYK